jgi:predicted signal transduction protein with EAL and GGDEF domain
MESLFRLADAACYAAKNAGRNQIHVIDSRTCIDDTRAIRTMTRTERNAEKEDMRGPSTTPSAKIR